MNEQKRTDASFPDFTREMDQMEKERHEMLSRIEASNAGQEKYAKKQYRMARISMLCNLAVLGIVVFLVVALLPRVNTTLRNLNYITEDLQTITSELAEVDFEQMVTDVDNLVKDSSRGLNSAVKSLNSIDFETLNEAIKNLNDTIKPLANFFNRF